MRNKFAALLLSAVMTVQTGLLIMPVFGEEGGGAQFDFAKDDAGFIPVFADYPGKSADEFYELNWGRKEVPDFQGEQGMFLSGNNHSDDLFMGYYKELNGLTPNQAYTMNISFELATDVEDETVGIGGSPGSSVYVKCGVTDQLPAVEPSEANGVRLNLDKGNQGTDGKDMKLAGTLTKQTSTRSGYEWNHYEKTVVGKADSEGKAYLVLGTDSGFEGVTSYYLGQVKLQWTPQEKEVAEAIAAGILDDEPGSDPVSRQRFCQFTYRLLQKRIDLPVAKRAEAPFQDVHDPMINTLEFIGVVSGRENGMFVPNDPITQEEAAVILYRAAEYAGLEMPVAKVDLAQMEDVSLWAVPYVVGLELMDLTVGEFQPKANYTVKEAAVQLMALDRLLEQSK